MAELPPAFLVHTIIVETRTGAGAYGDVFRPPVEIPAWVESTHQLVRGTNGREVVSTATVRTLLEHEQLFTPGSLVTVPNGRQAPVIAVSRHSDGGLGAWQHLEVNV